MRGSDARAIVCVREIRECSALFIYSTVLFYFPDSSSSLNIDTLAVSFTTCSTLALVFGKHLCPSRTIVGILVGRETGKTCCHNAFK